MTTLLKNIGTIDARQATAESLSQIGAMKNIGVIMISKEMRPYLQNISMENIGVTIEADKDVIFHVAPMSVTKEMLETAEEPLKLYVIGPVSFASDISTDLATEKISVITIIGPLEIPEQISGILMEKAKNCIGPMDIYNPEELALKGRQIIDNNFLNRLNEKTKIRLQGSTEIPADIDIELLKSKIEYIRNKGSLRFYDTHENFIQPLIHSESKGKISIIRTNTHYMGKDLVLDAFTLMSIEKEVIYSDNHIILGEDITPEVLSASNILFETTAKVYFPNVLSQLMLKKLVNKGSGVPYSSKGLSLITGNQMLTTARVNLMLDNSLLLVLGDLKIDEDVSVELIHQKIGYLDNYGTISAGKEVVGVLQSLLRHDEGHIEIYRNYAKTGIQFGEDDDNGIKLKWEQSLEELEEERAEEEKYDHIIQNAGNYTL